MDTAQKLAALRELMKQNNVQALIVTNADLHLSEYMAEHYKFRTWLSGFTGSAGTVLVTLEMAGLWTDGRYYLQAEGQLEGSGIALFRAGEPGTPTLPEYLAEVLPEGVRLGFDGRALSGELLLQLKKRLKKKNVTIMTNVQFVEMLWREERPQLPPHPLFALDLRYTGATTAEKLAALRKSMAEMGLDLYICGSLESAAWLTNLRAQGIIEFNATFPCFLAVGSKEAYAFLELHRLTGEIKESLLAQGLRIRDYGEIFSYVTQIPEGLEVGMDPKSINAMLWDCLPGGVIKAEHDDLIAQLKAVKNEAEIVAMREGHCQDAVAYIKFLRWFEGQPKGSLTEWDVSRKLSELRAARPMAMGDSFNAIIAYGPNAAMMHYAPDPLNSATIEGLGFLLMDSGGLYAGCTTDITRTIPCGELTPEERSQFTWVLQSMIGLSKATFLEGTGAMALDLLSRGLMWDHDLNYKCGTGHGVGAGLSVHEGPPNFRSPSPLRENMVITIEPGIYLDGVRGIRTENLVCVAKERFVPDVGQFFCFSELTLAPIDRRAIDVTQLSDAELIWLNAYHARVAETLQPYLDAEENVWLQQACAPLKR